MARGLILFLLAAASLQLEAQKAAWKNVDSAYKPLPPSVHVYRRADSLDGHPFIAYYLSAS